MRDIAFSGEVLPQKSTDFYPKLLSGMTIYSLEEERSLPTTEAVRLFRASQHYALIVGLIALSVRLVHQHTGFANLSFSRNLTMARN